MHARVLFVEPMSMGHLWIDIIKIAILMDGMIAFLLLGVVVAAAVVLLAMAMAVGIQVHIIAATESWLKASHIDKYTHAVRTHSVHERISIWNRSNRWYLVVWGASKRREKKKNIEQSVIAVSLSVHFDDEKLKHFEYIYWNVIIQSLNNEFLIYWNILLHTRYVYTHRRANAAYHSSVCMRTHKYGIFCSLGRRSATVNIDPWKSITILLIPFVLTGPLNFFAHTHTRYTEYW